MNAVEMLNPKTGEVVKTFRSARAAARYVIDVLGYKRKVHSVSENLYKICNGKTSNTRCYGYCWRYPAYAITAYPMPTTRCDVYHAIEHVGTQVDSAPGIDGCVYTIVKSVLSGEYVVSCGVTDERDHFMVTELSFKRFDDAYDVWVILGKAAPRLFIQDNDEFAE